MDRLDEIETRLDMIEDLLFNDEDFLNEEDDPAFDPGLTFEEIARILNHRFAGAVGLPAAMTDLRMLFGLA